MPTPATVMRYLKGIEYPADRDDLVAAAEEQDAPEEVMEALDDLEEQLYDEADEVREALGASDEDD